MATNNHVVEGSTEVQITFSDESTASAKSSWNPILFDLAVVKVNKSDLKGLDIVDHQSSRYRRQHKD